MEHTQRESMVFYDSFFEAIRDLPAEEYKRCANAILMYGLRGEMPETAGIEKTIFILVKPQIDKNNQRWINSKKSHAQKGDSKKKEQENAGEEVEAQVMPEVKEETKEMAAEPEIAQPVAVPEKQPEITAASDSCEETEDEEEFTVSEDEMIVSSCDDCSANENFVKPSGQKYAFGEFKNVYLSASETELLIKQLGIREYLDRLNFFSGYLKRKPGHRSACHFIDMRDWVGKAVVERRPKGGAENSSFLDVEFEDIFEKP